MPTTRAASAPSRRAIRKEEITRRVLVAIQLQVTKPSLVPPNHAVKAFCTCLALFRRLQYALMFASGIIGRTRRFGNGQTTVACFGRLFLQAIVLLVPIFLCAQ